MIFSQMHLPDRQVGVFEVEVLLQGIIQISKVVLAMFVPRFLFIATLTKVLEQSLVSEMKN